MLSLKKQLSDAPDAPDGHSFGERFRAWWDGYELEARPAAASGKATGGLDEEHSGDSEFSESDVGESGSGAADRYPPLDRSSPWPETRRKIAQLVWGDGFVVPGDAASITDLVQAFCLDSSSNMLEIGSGAGGGTRAIATQFGAYVAGFDIEQELCDAATDEAKVHSLDQQAAVRPLDLDKFEFKSEYYIGALIHDTLYRVPDKKAFFQKVVEAIKPGAQMVILDLFFADDAATSEMDRWRDGERSEAYGWQIEEAQKILGKMSVEIRITTDESDAYCTKIRETWQNFVRNVDEFPLPDELVLPMIDEAEFWARRVAAIQSGGLKLCRMSCIKSREVA